MTINVIKETVYSDDNIHEMNVEVSPEDDHLLVLVNILDDCGSDVLYARLHASKDTTEQELYAFLENRYGDVYCVLWGAKYFKEAV